MLQMWREEAGEIDLYGTLEVSATGFVRAFNEDSAKVVEELRQKGEEESIVSAVARVRLMSAKRLPYSISQLGSPPYVIHSFTELGNTWTVEPLASC